MTREFLAKMKRVEQLKNAENIRCLINEASEILGNPIFMHDTYYNVIAFTENVVTDDPIWNLYMSNRTASAEMQELFKEEGFIDAVADAKSIVFLLSDKLKYDRILGKVYNKSNVFVANLIIIACEKAFSAEDPVIFEAVCKTVSSVISSNEFYLKYGKSYEEMLIKKLLDGSFADRKLYSAHISILYNGLEENLFLAVLDPSKGIPESMELPRIKEMVFQMYPSFKCAIYSGYVVVIISSESSVLNVSRALKKLDKFCGQKKIFAGVSRRFENLFELSKCYADAVDALKRGMAEGTKQRIFSWEEGG